MQNVHRWYEFSHTLTVHSKKTQYIKDIFRIVSMVLIRFSSECWPESWIKKKCSNISVGLPSFYPFDLKYFDFQIFYSLRDHELIAWKPHVTSPISLLKDDMFPFERGMQFYQEFLPFSSDIDIPIDATRKLANNSFQQQ